MTLAPADTSSTLRRWNISIEGARPCAPNIAVRHLRREEIAYKPQLWGHPATQAALLVSQRCSPLGYQGLVIIAYHSVTRIRHMTSWSQTLADVVSNLAKS